MENHILVLGNGFDLYHGLNTRYYNFVNFCQEMTEGKIYYKDKV